MRENEPLARHNTLAVGGAADFYALPATPGEARDAQAFAKERSLPWVALGAGSNVLISDEGYRGVVIQTSRLSERRFEGERLVCRAGPKLSLLEREAQERGLGGLERLAGIPGSLGGSLAVNAGAFGVELSDLVEEAVILHADGVLKTHPAKELGFRYRGSDVEEMGILISATLKLIPANPGDIAAERAKYAERRRETQPVTKLSEGCGWKNPEGESAGRLIDQCGLKGFRVGNAEISDVHANFIVNRGGATAREVVELMRAVEERVYNEKGIRLQPEIRTIGEF